MKSNLFSRRGLLMGAATLAASRLTRADDTARDAAPNPPYAYLGCYTGGSNARGISVFHYDPGTNALTLVSIVAPVTSPSFIVLNPTKKFLYSGNEFGTGSASSFSVNSQTGDLRLLTTQG